MFKETEPVLILLIDMPILDALITYVERYYYYYYYFLYREILFNKNPMFASKIFIYHLCSLSIDDMLRKQKYTQEKIVLMERCVARLFVPATLVHLWLFHWHSIGIGIFCKCRLQIGLSTYLPGYLGWNLRLLFSWLNNSINWMLLNPKYKVFFMQVKCYDHFIQSY